jgi:Xaa-Pro dipeptidase
VARKRAAIALRAEARARSQKHAMVFQGAPTQYRFDTDHEPLFRQESYFYYLFGINEPDCYGLIDPNTGRSVLLVPNHGLEYEVWCGRVKPPAEYRDEYGVDEVLYTEQLAETLRERGIEVVHVIHGLNTDSKNLSPEVNFPGIEAFKISKAHLHREISECRVTKSRLEIDLLRYVVDLSCRAHRHVMRQICRAKFEYQLESLFCHYCEMRGGSRYLAYTCICGSGHNGATLHYGHAGAPNDRALEPGDMVLLDMGCEYQGYCSDITCSYPRSGKFSQDQREVYTAVLEAQRAVFRGARPGVLWSDMHRLADRVILEHLLKFGFLRANGKTVEELQQMELGAIFFPHGLGHFLGLDTHDVGGYPEGVERPKGSAGISKLRTNRVLQAGMVITVEPGCYFIPALVERAKRSPVLAPHLVLDKLDRFVGKFGGVRIEDDIVITENGNENLTTAPRTIEEIEHEMTLAPETL